MKKIILFSFLIFFITSCEIQYDGETKLVVQGNLIDENGIPLADKNIKITISSVEAYTSVDLISFGSSDKSGNFTLVFPSPKGGEEYDFSIVMNSSDSQTSEYQHKEIYAKKSNFKDYKLDLNKITLYKKKSITNLSLVLNNSNTNKELKDIIIEGEKSESFVDLNQMEKYQGDLITDYSVKKNQNLVLKYKVIDYSNSASATDYSIPISIKNESVTYTINY